MVWPKCIPMASSQLLLPNFIRFNYCSLTVSAPACCSPIVSASAAAPRVHLLVITHTQYIVPGIISTKIVHHYCCPSPQILMYWCIHAYMVVCKMRRCSSVCVFNWEGQCICSHYLPFAMESVSTTDHYDLTVVHQNNFHSLRSEHIVTMPGSFVEVRLKHIMFTARVVTMYKLRPRSGSHMPTTPSIWLHIHYTLQVEMPGNAPLFKEIFLPAGRPPQLAY